ncbi:hypothetical protein BC938DRAFT_483595 [Jimgerdemannia flammicorona]|uniref:Uncharacterized protein n=1 Tax=Jimgerdemannia flammicorona TaxID=994334 RepID=A0A433QBQ0_9FUNG|nr:hypothetical protein BC938DRAFT_483595 [Jimgerdemannia flammicorona]
MDGPWTSVNAIGVQCLCCCAQFAHACQLAGILLESKIHAGIRLESNIYAGARFMLEQYSCPWQ